jgi:hypothetical protein
VFQDGGRKREQIGQKSGIFTIFFSSTKRATVFNENNVFLRYIPTNFVLYCG